MLYLNLNKVAIALKINRLLNNYMITRIEVNGFKSLNNFSLDLNKGLNILVGPNGAGKTNIILFFEFLSLSCTEHIANSISKVGGAGAVFKKISFDEYEKEFSFKVYGTKKIQKRGKSSETEYLSYEYSATILNSFDLDNIFYSKQSFKFAKNQNFDFDHRGKDDWDFALDLDISEDNKFNISNFKIEKDIANNNQHIINSKSKSTSKINKNFVKEFLENGDLSHNCIINFLFTILERKTIDIIRDLKGGETFNIVPSKVKEVEDAANPPGIKKDGSGLAATLYAIKNERSKESYLDYPFFIFTHDIDRKYKKESLQNIVDYLKLANNTIENLDVINDPFDNRLVVKININADEYNSVLPLSAMSDGTIKWITIITAILTSNSIFSIEEPENFLHPWMQAEIVKIMRNHISNGNEEACVIMTTHSESLLNYSEPNELILVEMIGGQTKAIRIDDIEIIKSEISNSGLGLGHFYFSNSLFN